MSTPNPNVEPLTNKKRGLRIALFLGGIAAVIFGYRWFQGRTDDPGYFGTANTVGDILAVETVGDGQQVVLLKSDGTKLIAPGHKDGVTDRDPVWRPDGNFVFFASDREQNTFHIFRWNLEQNIVERRSTGTRAKGNIRFGVPEPGDDHEAVITSGGFVLSFAPKTGATHQLLPPVIGPVVSDDEGSAGGQFDAQYKILGTSFKEARWVNGRNMVAATMRRDAGEILIVQDLRPNTEGRLSPPATIVAGDRIDFDGSDAGKLVLTVQGFQFPNQQSIPKEFIKNGRIVPPYQNALFSIDLQTQGSKPVMIAVSPEDRFAFARPKISPDGESCLVLAGGVDDARQFTPANLLVVPIADGGISKATPIAPGNILNANWSPDGSRVVLVRREGSARPVYSVPSAGGEPTVVSKDGNFLQALFSPQLKK